MDEEAFQEEHLRLKAWVDGLQRDSLETRDRLKSVEKDSCRKDTLLQEMLAAATTAKGVPGEALDQIRDDVQVMMNIKRSMQDARRLLEEKDHKIRDICRVLRSTSIRDMEDEVESAKKQAKANAATCLDKSDSTNEAQCFWRSLHLQAEAKSHVQSLAAVQGEMLATRKRLLHLEWEQEKLRKAIDEHAAQMQDLQEKGGEITKQHEQCQGIIDKLGNVEERHKALSEEHQRSQGVHAAKQRSAGQQAREPQTVASEALFRAGFRPLRERESWREWCLLQRLRTATEVGWRSGFEALLSEDHDWDGYVSAPQLLHALEALHVKGGSAAAMQGLIKVLDPGLLASTGALVSTVDLVLALPLQTPPAGPGDDELAAAVGALAWACRRQGCSDREFRKRLSGWFAHPGTNLEEEAARLCVEFGLPDAPTIAGVLAKGLETRAERFAALLPFWRHMTPQNQASILVKFVHDVSAHRDIVVPLLSRGPLSLASFLELGREHLGNHWSVEDLEQVALLAECPNAHASGPPVADGPRLARAVVLNGIAAEFPDLHAHCHPDALRKCEVALKAPARRSSGSKSASAAPAGAPPKGRSAAATDGAGSGACTSPSSQGVSLRGNGGVAAQDLAGQAHVDPAAATAPAAAEALSDARVLTAAVSSAAAPAATAAGTHAASVEPPSTSMGPKEITFPESAVEDEEDYEEDYDSDEEDADEESEENG